MHSSTLSCFSWSDSTILRTVVHQASLPMGILQARILEWAVMPLSRRSSQPMEWTHIFYVSYISISTTWDAPYMPIYTYKYVWLFLFMSFHSCLISPSAPPEMPHICQYIHTNMYDYSYSCLFNTNDNTLFTLFYPSCFFTFSPLKKWFRYTANTKTIL